MVVRGTGAGFTSALWARITGAVAATSAAPVPSRNVRREVLFLNLLIKRLAQLPNVDTRFMRRKGAGGGTNGLLRNSDWPSVAARYLTGGGPRTAITTSRSGPGLRIEWTIPDGAKAASPADKRSVWSPI